MCVRVRVLVKHYRARIRTGRDTANESEHLTDKSLMEFARLPHLMDLFSEDSKITDEGIRHLSSSTTLTALRICFNEHITYIGIYYCSLMVSLKLLDISYCDL